MRQSTVKRCYGFAVLVALAVSSLPGAAAAGPMSISSKSAISETSSSQIEDVRYYRRYAYHRHYHYYRHYGYNPGPAIAGAAIGLMGAAALGAMYGGGYGYYGYPYGYPYGYGYGGW